MMFLAYSRCKHFKKYSHSKPRDVSQTRNEHHGVYLELTYPVKEFRRASEKHYPFVILIKRYLS